MLKNVTCIECPKGCEITVEAADGKIVEVVGNSCPRGKQYAINEAICPRRVLTTTVKTIDGKVVSVKTDKPVKKSDIFLVMDKVNAFVLKENVRIGDVILANVTEDINIVATKNYETNV